MKEKLINLIKELSNKRSLYKMRFSLTINYLSIISEYNSNDMFYDNVEKIIEIINLSDVKNFNFSLYESDKDKNTYEDDLDRYKFYWFESRIIFHGKKNIKTNFYFLSKGMSLNYLEKEDYTIDKLIEINEFYKDTSKKMYKLLC